MHISKRKKSAKLLLLQDGILPENIGYIDMIEWKMFNSLQIAGHTHTQHTSCYKYHNIAYARLKRTKLECNDNSNNRMNSNCNTTFCAEQWYDTIEVFSPLETSNSTSTFRELYQRVEISHVLLLYSLFVSPFDCIDSMDEKCSQYEFTSIGLT